MIYTDEQFKVLSQAEPHFNTVKKEYIRNAPRWLTEQIINVYEAATKKHILNKDLNCSICVMNIYKIVAPTYESDKLLREQKRVNTEQSETSRKQKETSETSGKTKRNTKKTKK